MHNSINFGLKLIYIIIIYMRKTVKRKILKKKKGGDREIPQQYNIIEGQTVYTRNERDIFVEDITGVINMCLDFGSRYLVNEVLNLERLTEDELEQIAKCDELESVLQFYNNVINEFSDDEKIELFNQAQRGLAIWLTARHSELSNLPDDYRLNSLKYYNYLAYDIAKKLQTAFNITERFGGRKKRRRKRKTKRRKN